MRVKITVEDSSERWITLDEAEAKELQSILNSLFYQEPKKIPWTEGQNADLNVTLDKESPETLRDPGSPHNIYNCYRYDCTPCKTLMGPKGTC